MIEPCIITASWSCGLTLVTSVNVTRFVAYGERDPLLGVLVMAVSMLLLSVVLLGVIKDGYGRVHGY